MSLPRQRLRPRRRHGDDGLGALVDRRFVGRHGIMIKCEFAGNNNVRPFKREATRPYVFTAIYGCSRKNEFRVRTINQCKYSTGYDCILKCDRRNSREYYYLRIVLRGFFFWFGGRFSRMFS